MKKTMLYLLPILSIASFFSPLEGKLCKRNSINAVNEAQLSGNPYATACTINPHGRNSNRIDFRSRMTSDPKVFEVGDNRWTFLLLEPGSYSVTMGGKTKDRHQEETLLVAFLESTEIGSVLLSGETTLTFTTTELVALDFEIHGYAKNVYVVVQKTDPI